VEGCAERLLFALIRSSEVPLSEAASRAASGWTTLVIAFPTPPDDGPPGLTDGDRDCLAYLATARRP
jgi:hypothetical protein